MGVIRRFSAYFGHWVYFGLSSNRVLVAFRVVNEVIDDPIHYCCFVLISP